MWFRFTDGSFYDEATVFSQRGTLKFLSDHVLQKGPAFRRPLETTIDANSGQVTVRYADDAKEKVLTERLELPPDVANGMLFALLKVQRSARCAGAIASLLGKQPPNMQVWVLADGAPALVRWDGPWYGDGPVWRIELAIPAVWPDSTAAVSSHK